jgi:hypothetical protein
LPRLAQCGDPPAQFLLQHGFEIPYPGANGNGVKLRAIFGTLRNNLGALRNSVLALGRGIRCQHSRSGVQMSLSESSAKSTSICVAASNGMGFRWA